MIKNYSIIILLFILISCTKGFLDINKDPKNPTDAELNQLLTTSELNISNSLGLSKGGLTSHLAVFMHQLVQRNSTDQYGTTGSDYAIIQSWNHLYSGALQDLQHIIDKGIESGDLRYTGIAKILKAYTYSVLVDMWGDVPYSEANKIPEIKYPKFDKGEEIYTHIFGLIDEGVANLKDNTAKNEQIPANDDLIYGGDINKWIKAAKTIKLKLLNQIREYKDVKNEINSLVTEGELISSADEDFEFPYGTSTAPEERNPGYITEYNDGNMTYYISPWFYELMTGKTSNPLLKGIIDPRIPYYWFNQVADYHNTQNPVEYGDEGFVSIYFGSIGVNRDQAQGQSATVIGLFPCGGRYNDKNPIPVSATGNNSGPGNVPFRIITYDSRLYIQAELAQTGVIIGNSRQFLISAIYASFDKVNRIATKADNKNIVPQISTDEINKYAASVIAQFDFATAEQKMEIILTQKWIASFGNSIDQYNDYRRTGYPKLFDPNAEDEMTPPGKDLAKIPTQSSRSFPLSLPWSSQDLELNPNAPAQKNPVEFRIFWDIK